MALHENDKYTNTEPSDEDLEFDFDDEDDDSPEEKGAPAWLASYSDMMTDLMAIFVILFAFAAMATSSENKDIKEELENIKNQTSASSTVTGGVEDAQTDDELDKIYESIKEKIEQSGYADSILLEKTKGYIKFQFRDNVLFYPDSPTMRESSFSILQYMGDLLASINSNIGSIEISGHTAKVGEDSNTNFFAWELSSNRAIAVLKFLVNKCSLPQSKMIVSGYSHYQPVSGNDQEKDRAQNRRVDIKIVRVTPKA